MGQFIQGDRALIQKLGDLKDKHSKDAVRKATREACKQVLQPACKSEAPVDTGTLKRSIKTRAMKRKVGQIGHAVKVEMKGETKANMFYAAFQEYGWTTVNGRKIPGKHFLRKATEEKGEAALNMSVKLIDQHIQSSMKE